MPTLLSSPLVRLLGRLRPIAWQAAGAYGAMLVATGMTLAVPLALRSIVDAAIGGGANSDALDWLPGVQSGPPDQTRLLMGAAALVLLGLVRALLSFVERYGTAWVGRTVATDFRRDVFDKLVHLDIAFHDKSRVGQLMTRVTDDTEQVRAFAATGLAELVNIAVLLVGSSVVLLRLDPLLAAVALGTLPVLAGLAFWGGRSLGPRFLVVQQATGRLTARLQESLAQIRVVQAFRAEARSGGAYQADNAALFGKRMALVKIFTTIFPAMGVVLGLATAVVLLLGGQRVIEGDLSIGTIVAFDSYILLLGAPVRRLGFLLNLASRASTSARRVYELLDRDPALREAPDAAQPVVVAGEVAWHGMDFAYDEAAVLSDIELTISPGEHVAIVGQSGAGKTALVELLPRLYDPSDGSVTLDGRDLRTLSQPTLRGAIGYVEQEAFLFSASVRDNVAFAKPEATVEEVQEACRLAGADDFVRALPDGYDTVVGDRGVTLSGGQRQRIALARALVRRPPVLVLDDAVSAVDAGTEGRIRAGLTRVDGDAPQTVVSVAQRLSTILSADRIVMLQAGRIVEQGTHRQLMDADGPYAHLFRRTLAASGAAA